MLTIEQAEERIGHETFLAPGVKPGAQVFFGAWVITITEVGYNCDCGKAVFCPLNKQTRR
jgi:hypothetical protein